MTATGCEFSAAHYQDVLRRIAREYDPLRFCDWRPRTTRPRVFLRHDIDHSLVLALQMAEMEAAARVRATYFVQLHAELYSATSRRAVGTLRRIIALGHEIGLHYDTGFYRRLGLEPAKALRTDLAVLADLAGVPVQSASRHFPTLTPTLATVGELVEFDAYSDRFAGDLKYISDSNMDWREGCVCGHLASGLELQVLLHPVWWLAEGAGMSERILGCAAVEVERYQAEAESVAGSYREWLAQREVLDGE